MVTKDIFACLSDGRVVHSYKITNSRGEYVTLLDYGATIQEIVVGDGRGGMGDVVLGAKPDELESCGFRGGTIGRCANRIAGASFTIDGKTYALEKNQGENILHSGSGNYANRLFSGQIEDGNTVSFHLEDGGEAGFGCRVQADFIFSFTDEGCLGLRLEMKPYGPTVLNPTNHAYFNLTGEFGDVRRERLWIASDQIASRDKGGVPSGGVTCVTGTPADFTTPRVLGEAMDNDVEGYFPGGMPGYDEFYVFDSRQWRAVARLEDGPSGRVMDVYTDMPGVVLYCSGGRKPYEGKNGHIYRGYSFVCIETGFVPNAVNCPEYVSPVFREGEKLVANTVYKFSVK